MADAEPTRPVTPAGVSHLVLNVRDLEASHRFYTEVLGFEQCGELGEAMGLTMRFYRSSPNHHHDIALNQLSRPEAEPPVERWNMVKAHGAVNHIAVAYPGREAWLAQVRHLQASGVEILVRGDHGMTHSAYVADPDGNGIEVLYDLPDEVWEGDVNAALNHFKPVSRHGDAALEDDTDYVVFGRG